MDEARSFLLYTFTDISFIRDIILYGLSSQEKQVLCDYFNLESRVVNDPELHTYIGSSGKKFFVSGLKCDSRPLYIAIFEEIDVLFPKRKSNVSFDNIILYVIQDIDCLNITLNKCISRMVIRDK